MNNKNGNDLVNEIKSKYFKIINMNLRELREWKKNPHSRLASVSEKPLNRTIGLVKKKNRRWTTRDAKKALSAIGFIKRMKKNKAGSFRGDSGLSGKTISLKNWGYNPNK